MECKICKKKCISFKSLSQHIRFHNISSENYYGKFLKKEELRCCECKKKTKFKSLSFGYQKYCGSKCANSNKEKCIQLSLKMRNWWKTSDKVGEVKTKISKSVTNLWKNENSIFNDSNYRKNLSIGSYKHWSQEKEKWLNGSSKIISENIKFEIIGEYKNAHAQTTFKCKQCNHIFQTLWNYIQGGKQCPKCFPSLIDGRSKAEKEIEDLLSSEFKIKNIIINSKKIISPLEIDIYIPSKNIAIEFNGLYWHSDIFISKNYHLNKTKECEKQGIQLIHIFEDEWIFKKDIVKSKLRNILSIQPNVELSSNDCKIKEIDPKTKNEFLNNNHIQGKVNSDVNIGSFYKGELISLMTFSKENIDNVWELNRFCSKLNHSIIGIAEKLLSHFKKNYKWKEIFSYADRRWDIGYLYYNLGFELIKETDLSYWHIRGYKRIRGFNLKKKKDEPIKLLEQIIKKSSINNIIWDCGNLKFSLYENS